MSDFPFLPVIAGIDNVHSPDHEVFQLQAEREQLGPPRALVKLINVDLHSDGKIVSRPGVTSLASITEGKRLMSKGGALFALDGDNLYQVSPASPSPLSLLVDELDTTVPFLLHEWPRGSGKVFLGCGTVHRQIENGQVKNWGLPVPTEFDAFPIAGELLPGRYLITVTFLDGPITEAATQESGAPTPIEYVLEETGGFRVIVAAPNPAVTHASFYVSGPDQAEPFRIITLEIVTVDDFRGVGVNVVTRAGLANAETPVLTQGWGPPLQGMTALGSLQSFVLAGVGKALYRAWAGRPGLFFYARAFQLFPSDITTILGLQDGVFVGTTGGVYWLEGDKPETWLRRKVSDSPVFPEGIVMDGEDFPALETDGLVAIFVTPTGVIAGLPGGKLRPLTRGSYHFPDIARVSITYRTEPSFQLFIASSTDA
jgi:hypothetical protein